MEVENKPVSYTNILGAEMMFRKHLEVSFNLIYTLV